MSGPVEQILAERLKKGDRQAMKELYGLYSGFLNAVCSRYVVDKEAVKDILQDSFIKIFSSASSFRYRGEGSLKAWMKKIVVNDSLKYLRKSDRYGFVVSADTLPDIPEQEDEPDFMLESVPPSVIQKMVRRLPDGYRTIFNLYVFEDKSHKEIAGILGIKENSSASQLHRAKALLAKWIKEYLTEQ